jgi:hypothetical protein
MKVIVTREFLNGHEKVAEGTELSVAEARGRALMKNKLVVQAPSELGAGTVRTRRAARQTGTASPRTAGPAATAPAPVQIEADTNSTPSATRRIGGRPGAAKQSSSSRQGRQRTARRSTKAAAAPAT